MITKIKDNLKKIFIGFFLFLLSLIILFSLTTSSSEDNTFFKYNSLLETPINFLGYFGSILSDFLLKIFGVSSYLICLFFFLSSFRVLQGKSLSWYAWAFLPITIIMLCFFLHYISENFLQYDIKSGILGDGLNFYFSYFFQNSNYLNWIILSMFCFSVLCLMFTFNISLSGIKKFTLFSLQKLFFLIIFISRLLNFKSATEFKFFSSPIRNKEGELLSKVKKSKSSNFKISTLSNYKFPSIELLEKEIKIPGIEIENKKNTEINRSLLSSVLKDFKITGEITDVRQGPIVTLFELTPAPGTLSSSVIRLSEDIARSMSAKSTRISTIPGKDALGIELPNKQRQTVFLRELLDDPKFKNNKFKLPLALGKDIFGKPVIVDLSEMPHLLVAGTTGSGKSVGINAMLLSLLYYLTPEECRLILIDPKMLELSVYQDIPHLLTEVVTDPKKAISALKWTVKEMEKRYQMMTHLEVREIDDYNKKVKRILDSGQVVFKEMQVGYDSETGKPVIEKKALDLALYPKIVVVVDELADLMITSGKEIEGAIQRLSQMARAAGIHLIVATQRPSVDVITGTIKSNFPTRISYKVVNKINSRTIIEEQGAEQLLGQGDLLITMLGESLLRVHGPFVRTEEVQAVVNHLKKQGEPEYHQSVTVEEEEVDNYNLGLNVSGDDLYDKAVSIVCREKRASTSFIQRHLQIGYNRAARIIEKMESEGIVSPANHVGRREVLVGKDD